MESKGTLQSNWHILCIGLCCVDDIHEVHQFPKEDTDNRCISRVRQRGGNASNNCTVLGILDSKPFYLGVIANSMEKGFIENDFLEYNIDFSQAVVADNCECPISCAILSQATGSRTVFHYNKNLPELSFNDFRKVDISLYSWIHFEGRNVSEVKKMMEFIHSYNANSEKKIRISVELEKTRDDLKKLMSLADILFISKEFALMEDCSDMKQALTKLSKSISPNATLICPWGELGASAIREGQIYWSPSYPPEKVVDTLGAGDTFVASTIYAMTCGASVEESIQFGCRVAGAKVGIKGWKDFKVSNNNMNFVLEFRQKYLEKQTNT